MALVEPGFPVLAFTQDDETRPGVEDGGRDCATNGAKMIEGGGARKRRVCTHLPALARRPGGRTDRVRS